MNVHPPRVPLSERDISEASYTPPHFIVLRGDSLTREGKILWSYHSNRYTVLHGYQKAMELNSNALLFCFSLNANQRSILEWLIALTSTDCMGGPPKKQPTIIRHLLHCSFSTVASQGCKRQQVIFHKHIQQCVHTVV